MTLDEVIAELQQVRIEHGNLDVYISADDEWNRVRNFSDITLYFDEEEDPDSERPLAAILFMGYDSLPGHWSD